MVTRVGKFVGGLGQDLTNKANAHATENRIAFGASINPTANVHVVGTVLATTTVTATGGFLVPDDGVAPRPSIGLQRQHQLFGDA